MKAAADSKKGDLKKNNQPAKPATNSNSTAVSNSYPEQIPEAQGDLADRANIEIDQEIQEKILRVRQNIPTVGRSYTSDIY